MFYNYATSDDNVGRYEILESHVDPKLVSFEDYLTKLMVSPKRHSISREDFREVNQWPGMMVTANIASSKKNSDLEVEEEPMMTYDSSDARLNEIFPKSSSTESTSKVEAKVLESREDVKPVIETTKTPANSGKASIEDQISQISLQNPEYRMMGPNRSQEILMGDDVASTLLVALDNMQQEAKELWGQVSETVDDQWTQLKKMIERNLEPASKTERPSNTFATRRLQSTGDMGLDVPSAVDPGAVSDNKANTFLNNIGISTDTQKKAGELISNAGTSIKEVAQKDLPVAYEKAKSALSETVTKDIPNYWNKLFGGNKTTN